MQNKDGFLYFPSFCHFLFIYHNTFTILFSGPGMVVQLFILLTLLLGEYNTHAKVIIPYMTFKKRAMRLTLNLYTIFGKQYIFKSDGGDS